MRFLILCCFFFLLFDSKGQKNKLNLVVSGISIQSGSNEINFSEKHKKDIPNSLLQKQFLPKNLVFNSWDGYASESSFGVKLYFKSRDSVRTRHEYQFGIVNSRQTVNWFASSDTTFSLKSRTENFYLHSGYAFSFLMKEKIRISIGGFVALGFQISVLSDFFDPVLNHQIILYGNRKPHFTSGIPIQVEFRVLRLFYIRLGPHWDYSYRTIDGIGGGNYQNGFFTAVRFIL